MIAWKKRLLSRVFSIDATDFSVVEVQNRSLSHKTIFLVCSAPEGWGLEYASYLQTHVVSLETVRTMKPRHAKIIDAVLDQAERIRKQQVKAAA